MKSIREGREFKVQSGFRVWEDKSEKDTDASGDAAEFTIKFTDFGIDDTFLIDPSPQVSVTTASGALHLCTGIGLAAFGLIIEIF